MFLQQKLSNETITYGNDYLFNHGTKKLYIKTNDSGGKLAYPLTTDTSASQYCKFKIKVANGSTAYLAKSGRSYYVSSNSNDFTYDVSVENILTSSTSTDYYTNYTLRSKVQKQSTSSEYTTDWYFSITARSTTYNEGQTIVSNNPTPYNNQPNQTIFETQQDWAGTTIYQEKIATLEMEIYNNTTTTTYKTFVTQQTNNSSWGKLQITSQQAITNFYDQAWTGNRVLRRSIANGFYTKTNQFFKVISDKIDGTYPLGKKGNRVTFSPVEFNSISSILTLKLTLKTARDAGVQTSKEFNLQLTYPSSGSSVYTGKATEQWRATIKTTFGNPKSTFYNANKKSYTSTTYTEVWYLGLGYSHATTTHFGNNVKLVDVWGFGNTSSSRSQQWATMQIDTRTIDGYETYYGWYRTTYTSKYNTTGFFEWKTRSDPWNAPESERRKIIGVNTYIETIWAPRPHNSVNTRLRLTKETPIQYFEPSANYFSTLVYPSDATIVNQQATFSTKPHWYYTESSTWTNYKTTHNANI